MPDVLPQDIADLAGLFDEIGLTLKKSAKVVLDAHKADRIAADEEGSVIIPDHKIRLEAAKVALALRGYSTQNTKTKHEGSLTLEFVGFQSGKSEDTP